MGSVAIKFQNAYKKYNSGDFILNDLQMTVPTGIIYGVLGASGCGKTTMLSCILGIKPLDSGVVYVSPDKTIGYMPQEIGLYETFTVAETLNYFGKLNGMSKSDILEKQQLILSLLDLNDPNKRIGSMSGGQKRRASLAAALLHDPSILILDEPTVGLDPLIRQKIWRYLQELVRKKGTTILITTHYVEEAKDCDMVSFMSNGKLLVEKSPNDLLEEYNTNFLEDVFLKLCKKDSKPHFKVNNNSSQSETLNSSHHLVLSKTNPESVTSSKGFLHHLNLIWILLLRNFLLFWRFPLILFLVLGIALFQVIVANIILSGEPANLPFGILNEEFKDGLCSRNNTKFSCKFIENIPSDLLQKKFFHTEDNALECIVSGNCLGYLRIPNNFTNDMMDRLIYRNHASNETLDGSLISVKMDNADYLKSLFIQKKISELYYNFLNEIVSDLGGDPRMVQIPLKFNAIFHEGSYIEFLQYPLVMIIVFLTPLTAGWIHIYDKRSGILNRTSVVGVNLVHLVISHFICELCVISVQIALTMGVQIFFFNLNIHGSLVLLFLLTVTIGICAFSFGMLCAVIWDTEIEVNFAVLIVYCPTMVSSGYQWPREGVQYFAKIIYNLLPAAFPIEASRAIVSRGFTFSHLSVWPGFALPFVWIFINCIICTVFKRKFK